MEIARRLGLARSVQRFRTRLVGRRAEVGPLRPRLPSVAKALSGCYSNEHGQQPLRRARWAGPWQGPYPATVNTSQFARRLPISSAR